MNTSDFEEAFPAEMTASTASTGTAGRAPMTTVPDNRHKVVPKLVEYYFDQSDKVACEAAQGAVDTFQEAQKELAIRYHTGVVNLFAKSVVDLDQAHREVVERGNEAYLANEVARNKKEVTAAKSSAVLIKKKLAVETEKNEQLNVKFHGCFKVFLDEWDGTREHAIQLLEDAEKEEADEEG